MPLTDGMMKNYKKITEKVNETGNTDTGEIDVHDIVIRLLYDQLFDRTDDVLFLLKNGRFFSIESILRTCIEMAAYIRYIFISNNRDVIKKRARACYYWNKVDSVNKAQEILKTYSLPNKEAIELKLSEDLSRLPQNFSSDEEYREYHLKKLNECYSEQISKRKRKYWFNHNGSIDNIRKLFEYVGMTDDYSTFYRPFSDATHGLGSLKQIRAAKNSFGLEKTLPDETIKSLLNGYLFFITKQIINYYNLEAETRTEFQVIKINFKKNYF
ncbi:DUF5677 domain-containing protein [Tetragenococcus koreensis]|uniref:DUF5677 domain-containing protein n=1 Tax=Tetragenococcus koreensis TaxID=290335 RepID=UPI001F40FE59|nr:DUF5677 domain-containing protein [Tetragenococcus koreensis]MCF1617341.1 DUF5677 domain-containing protein [Tetragenococcus koreensis]